MCFTDECNARQEPERNPDIRLPLGVNGSWSSWGEWSNCSDPCNGGTQTRMRGCDNPAPSGGGDGCEGDEKETQACIKDKCAKAVNMPSECDHLGSDGLDHPFLRVLCRHKVNMAGNQLHLVSIALTAKLCSVMGNTYLSIIFPQEGPAQNQCKEFVEFGYSCVPYYKCGASDRIITAGEEVFRNTREKSKAGAEGKKWHTMMIQMFDNSRATSINYKTKQVPGTV